jgi:hypothetical protein
MSAPSATSDEPLWDAVDVARYLKVSRSWTYQQAEAGVLPCLRIVGVLRFDPNVIRAFARGESFRPGKVLWLDPSKGKVDHG